MTEKYVIVNIAEYPKFTKEWLNSKYSIEQTLKNSGINSAIRVPAWDKPTNLRLRYGMNERDFTWFVLRWS